MTNCKNISILRIFFKMRSLNFSTFSSEKIFMSFLKCEDHEFCFSVSCDIFCIFYVYFVTKYLVYMLIWFSWNATVNFNKAFIDVHGEHQFCGSKIDQCILVMYWCFSHTWSAVERAIMSCQFSRNRLYLNVFGLTWRWLNQYSTQLTNPRTWMQSPEPYFK